MRKRRATNRTLHTVAAIAVAALTATACGGDEPAVVEPVEPIPVETTEAPTTDAASPADVDAPAADEDVDPAVEQDETPATTTTETEVPASEDAVTEEAPSSAVIEDESAGELAGEPAVEELPLEDPEPGSDLNTAPGEPAVEQDETSQPDEASEPAPEPEPEEATEAPEQEQPETEQASQPVEPVEDALEPEPTDPWERVTNEPVLASELWPEGDENGNPYPDDDLYCHVPSGGEFECYYTTPAPEPEPEPEPEQEPAPEFVWTPPQAGTVPEVHPDVPSTEWQRGPVNPGGRAYDKPRTTEAVQEWRDWCYPQWGGNCEWVEHNMYQAIDYLGANERCVLNEYTKKAEYFLSQGSGANNSYAKNTFGWHLCSTVIDPIVGEIPDSVRDNDVGLRLSDTPGITLAGRCRTVLTDPFPDLQLEARRRGDGSIPPIRFGQDCDAWAKWIIENGLAASAPDCNESSSLAEEWMEHHHNQHESYHRPHC